MDLQLSTAHLRFRNELRAWLAANVPRPWREELRDPHATETSLIELRRAWQKKLYQAGYLGMDWPEEWGGRGSTEVEKSIMEAELARADAPPVLNILGIGLLGPALIHHGSEAQRRRFIQPMLSGDEIWCQGFSEPGAGSDLAALKTAVRPDGDHFVLSGQKVWTTFGPWADWIVVLARTDAKDRYGGISFLLVKLDTPGEETGTPAGSLLDLAPHPTSGLDVHCDGSTGNSLVDEAADFPGPQAQSIAGTVHLSR